MKKLSVILCLLSCILSCDRINPGFDIGELTTDKVPFEAIVLGRKLENPYSFNNIAAIVDSLYGSLAASRLQYTHRYVRFLPRTVEDLNRIMDIGVDVLDYPVDYEIVKEGNFYHDPEIPEDQITWQYAVVPRESSMPRGILYEDLEKCYIMEDYAFKSSDGIDWNLVEQEAYRKSGNAALWQAASTKGGSVSPSGRITITDPDYNGGQPCGVSGVKVSCNVFVRFSSAYTDRDGYYQIPGKFGSNPRYRLVFENQRGFTIGLNTIVYKASVSPLGKAGPAGISVEVDQNSDRALFRRCAANNSICDFYQRCAPEDLGLPMPPQNLSFWIFDSMDESSTLMLHHGTVLDLNIANIYFKLAAKVVQMLGPDITLGTSAADDFKSIYSLVVHEMAHACHFQKVDVSYWDKFIYYIVSSYIGGSDTYGDGDGSSSGICELGEMWAYYLESKMYMERYGGTNPMFGTGWWFYPQIFTSLEGKGFTAAEIIAAFDTGLKSCDSLKEKLVNMYPERKTTVNQVFNRYAR